MRIDAHHHLWIYNPVRYQWINEEMAVIRKSFFPETFFPFLTKNRIDGTVVIQSQESSDETNFLLDLAKNNKWIKGVVGWVDLTAEDVAIQIAEIKEHRMLKGIRCIAQTKPDDFLISDNFLRGMRILSKTNLTYDILIYPSQLPAAIEMVKKFPKQRFVLDHMAKPFIKRGMIDIWAKQIQELALLENVSCKISGLVTEANWQYWEIGDFRPYLDIAFKAFGIKRLIFGSDFPVCLVAAEYHEVLSIMEEYFYSFSESDQSLFFGENAINFYNL